MFKWKDRKYVNPRKKIFKNLDTGEILNLEVQDDPDNILEESDTPMTDYCLNMAQDELVDDMSKTHVGTNITAPTVAGVGRTNKVRGFCRQETREGRNLFNINDKSDFNTNVSTDEDDWIHVSYDNSSGTTYAYINTRTKKSNELTINTDYYLVLEIKEISGTGGIAITDNSANQGQFNTAPQLDFSKLSKGTYKYLIHSTANFDTSNSMTRTFVFFGAGKKRFNNI